MEQFLQIFLAVCGGIITTAGAGTAIYHLWKAIRQPDAERDRMMREHEKKLDNCTNRLDNVEGGMAVLMKATLAMMNHITNGDNEDEIKKATEDIQDYLISQKTDILRNKEG